MGDLVEKYPEDFNEREIKALEDYISHGCPGLTRCKDSDVHIWFKLYMSGKSYNEIAGIMKCKRDLVLYMSKRHKWLETRLTRQKDLIDNVSKKVMNIKLESTNTIATMISALNKYYGGKFERYIATSDKTIIDKMDTKMLSQYYKSIETLDKIVSSTIASKNHANDKTPTVNINMQGGSVKQVDDDTLEVTSDENVGNILRILAQHKKSTQDS